MQLCTCLDYVIYVHSGLIYSKMEIRSRATILAAVGRMLCTSGLGCFSPGYYPAMYMHECLCYKAM